MLAEHELAGFCLDIFEHYRPGEVTAVENGPFVTFVDSVYGVATGKKAKFVRPIERACRNWKAFHKRKVQDFPEGLPDDRMIWRHGDQWDIAVIQDI